MPLFKKSTRADAGPPPVAKWRRMYAELVGKAFRLRFHDAAKHLVVPIEPSERPFDGEILAIRLADRWKLVTVGIWRPLEPGQEPIPGLELTVNLPVTEAPEPDPWGVRLLRSLADQVVGTRQPFLPGHRLENNNPIDGDPASTATCLLFTEDRDLRTIKGPMGEITLVQAYPVTCDELQRAKDTSTEEVVDQFRAESPDLVVTTLRR